VHRHALHLKLRNRSDGSIERKHISPALIELGLSTSSTRKTGPRRAPTWGATPATADFRRMKAVWGSGVRYSV